mgnify:CR=1 FL=1
MKKLTEYNGKIFTDDMLVEAIQALGVKNGDVLCVHSDTFRLGKPLLSKQEYMSTLCAIFKQVIGDEGTLIMPAFSYSFCRGQDYDVIKSPSTVGALTEAFRKERDVKRTHHPIFSFAVWGANKEYYCDVGLDAFGLDSVYGKMIQNGGKILFLGANKGYTIYHLAEEHVGVPHRFFKNFSGNIIDEMGSKYHIDVPYYVRYLDCESSANEGIIEHFLRERSIQEQITYANGIMSIVDAKECYEAFVEQLRGDRSYFVGE